MGNVREVATVRFQLNWAVKDRQESCKSSVGHDRAGGVMWGLGGTREPSMLEKSEWWGRAADNAERHVGDSTWVGWDPAAHSWVTILSFSSFPCRAVVRMKCIHTWECHRPWSSGKKKKGEIDEINDHKVPGVYQQSGCVSWSYLAKLIWLAIHAMNNFKQVSWSASCYKKI